MTHRRDFCALALPAALGLSGLAAGLRPSVAAAQAWPSKPIRLIIPYTPGGYTDNMSRLLGEALAKSLGQPFVYDNKPGANSQIGTGMAATSPPDGYTLVTVIAAHAANPSLYPKLPYDSVGSFDPVTLITIAPLLMAAGPGTPFNDIRGLIAHAKANPGKVTFGSSGQGAAAHLAMEYFCLQTGVKMVHIPYKGTAPALTDLMGGQIDVMFDTVSAFSQQIASKRVKGLGVASTRPIPAAAAVPTISDSGVPGFEASTWAMVLAPKGTPSAIVERLSAESKKAIGSPDLIARFDEMGLLAAGTTPAETKAFLKSEIAKWGEVIRKADVKIDQ